MHQARENLERNFGFILNDVARLLRTAYDRRIKDLGLTRAQWWVLNHLYRHEGASQAELAEILEIERPSLGRLLDRLEEKGWVERRPCAQDRRAKRVYLTEADDGPIRQLRKVAAELRRDALAGLGGDEQERFVDMLLTIKSNLAGEPNGNGGRNGRAGKG
jgi:DNA-binding MarR family transcriptional regulator